MKLAVIGDGKMGRAITDLAPGRGHQVTAVIGRSGNEGGQGIDRERLGDPDLAIEFTEPGAAVSNVLACIRAGVPVVVGTTGWYNQLDAVIAEASRADAAMFWAPNFSVGIAVLSAAVEAASAALHGVAGFDVHLLETHHAAKKDRPSGTALALADAAGHALGRAVPVTSVRTGHVPGTHELVFDAAFEQVRLVHDARDRRVFVDGVIAAAEWFRGRRGVFTMRDMIRGREDRP
jgi:4-hydroxy-tetrahydrodipicolinate reductase